jgi:hypothetical protein
MAKVARRQESRSCAMGESDTARKQSTVEETSGVYASLWQSPRNVDLSCIRDSQRRITRAQHSNS